LRRKRREKSKPKERKGCVVCMCGTNELRLLRIEATSEMKRRERGREREEKDSEKRQREGRQRGGEEQRERGKKHDQCTVRCEREKVTITRKSQLTAVIREKKQKKV